MEWTIQDSYVKGGGTNINLLALLTNRTSHFDKLKIHVPNVLFVWLINPRCSLFSSLELCGCCTCFVYFNVPLSTPPLLSKYTTISIRVELDLLLFLPLHTPNPLLSTILEIIVDSLTIGWTIEHTHTTSHSSGKNETQNTCQNQRYDFKLPKLSPWCLLRYKMMGFCQTKTYYVAM